MQVSFGKIYTGKSITDAIAKDVNIKKQANSIKRLLRNNDLHKTKYTDVILQYNENDGFYGVISSKTQGVPMNPGYHSDTITKKTLNNFRRWITGWDEAFNPKTMDRIEKTTKL